MTSTHHGMYPLYQNQTPYYWESENGRRLLVWSGEHHNHSELLQYKRTSEGSLHE